MKKLFLVGYYGFNNFGDEILLNVFLDHFSAHKIYVLHTTSALAGNVRYIKRFSPFALIKAICDSDVIVFGGGGLLQDSTSSVSLFYYLTLIMLSKLFGKKICLAFQGIGPVIYPGNQRVMSLVFRFAVDYISVRDNNSLQLLRLIGYSGHISVVEDPSIQYFFSRKIEKKDSDTSTKILGINVRETGLTSQSYDQFVHVINEYCIKYGYRVRLFILQPSQEIDLVNSISGRLQVPYEIRHIDADNFASEFVCDRLISMRLHLLVLGYVFAIPLLGIKYDPKVTAFLDNINAQSVNLGFDDLASKLDLLLRDNHVKLNENIAASIADINKGFARLDLAVGGKSE